MAEVVAAPVVSYAMAHGGIAFLHRIVVTVPPTVGDVDDLFVHAEVVDAQGDVLTRPWQHHVDSLRAGVPSSSTIPRSASTPGTSSSSRRRRPPRSSSRSARPARSSAAPTPRSGCWPRASGPSTRRPVLSLELLASFVQPNHPAVGPVVARAAAILADRTKSGSLQVTYVDPERIDAIVEAVFTAVHELDVYYAEPPASWGYGQKVRTPGDVFEQRVGTCLDTTVALASCLEHLGITPVIWVARGHAFLGYWRRGEQGLPDAASLQVAPGANAVDLGLMGVVETTMVTRERRPPRDLFRRAGQAPRDGYFVGGSSSWSGWSTWAWPGSCGCSPFRPAVSARTGSSSSSSTPRRTRWPGPPPPARRPAYPSRHPGPTRDRGEPTRHRGSRPGRTPSSTSPCATGSQPRRPDDPGATRHAE